MAELILDYFNGQDPFENHRDEKTILSLVQTHDEENISSFLERNSNWVFLYHLKRERENLLSVVNFDKNDSVLEIGAQCGALSSAIVNKVKELDCVELSKTHSEINFERNKDKDSLRIFIGDFSTVCPHLNKKYDKIFLVGSLAYASVYVKGEDPQFEILKLCKSLLKDNGEIYVAIENKYGMKYFNGAKEDHTKNTFESIEGYQADNYKTFSNAQLRNLMKNAGFSEVFFYYPLPDYKFANVIFSEEYLPGDGMIKNTAHDLETGRTIIFSEDKALTEAASSDMFEVFANSYFIRGRK